MNRGRLRTQLQDALRVRACVCVSVSISLCVSTRMGCFGSVRFHRVNICTVFRDLKKENLFEYLWMWSNTNFQSF